MNISGWIFLPLLLKVWQVEYNHLPQGGSAIYTGIRNETNTTIAAAENRVTTIWLE